jgi:hypothetical protein
MIGGGPCPLSSGVSRTPDWGVLPEVDTDETSARVSLPAPADSLRWCSDRWGDFERRLSELCRSILEGCPELREEVVSDLASIRINASRIGALMIRTGRRSRRFRGKCDPGSR